jgi:hypothetical protein
MKGNEGERKREEVVSLDRVGVDLSKGGGGAVGVDVVADEVSEAGCKRRGKTGKRRSECEEVEG